MSSFRTPIPKISFPFGFHHHTSVLCLGSCFAEHIGEKLKKYKFSSLTNPSGILYNPHSIGDILDILLNKRVFTIEDLTEHQGLWHSFYHHGVFSNISPEATLLQINATLQNGIDFLKKTNRLILTLGTSNVFVYRKTQQIVANCHKIPNQEFERKTLAIDTICKKLISPFQQLKTVNPDLEILLTVSPVRHTRDGLIENQRSKARLLLASEKIDTELDYVHYFPSYEIMMDDLREYRFYEPDMIHPNSSAIDYIWDYFGQSFFKKDTMDLNMKIQKVINATKHRPFHLASDAHQHFLQKQLQIIQELEAAQPFLDFSKEQRILGDQLID